MREEKRKNVFSERESVRKFFTTSAKESRSIRVRWIVMKNIFEVCFFEENFI